MTKNTCRRGRVPAVLLFSALVICIVSTRKQLQKVHNLHNYWTFSGNGTDTSNAVWDPYPSASSPSLVDTDAMGSALALLRAARELRPIFDESIDIPTERERCNRYGLNYTGRPERRRVFWGSLVADDSWHTLGSMAMETYGIFHTLAFVESNRTQMFDERKLRFGSGSANKKLLQGGMFGPDAKVTVDYYVNESPEPLSLVREHHMRALILERWKENGMTKDDIGYLSDADETFTRDFIRAMQICDVPQFRPDGHRNCAAPKIYGLGIIFEGSPECITVGRNWFHPDMIIGECVHLIGDARAHPPAMRVEGEHGWREVNFTINSNYEGLPKNATHFPLWNAADFRRTAGGFFFGDETNNVGYHFHNFFSTVEVLRKKYLTYGHPVKDADTKPLRSIHQQLELLTDCALNRSDSGKERSRLKGGLVSLVGQVPLAFQLKSYVKARHEELGSIIRQDEQ